jgi:Kef-type K+ transport system membrane component KefB
MTAPGARWCTAGRGRRLPRAVVALAATAALVVLTPRLVDGTGHGGLDPLARFLFAAAVVVFVCHACGALLRRFHQPAVVGEVLGGIVLGPSVLGALWPNGMAALFTTEVRTALGLAAQLGLVTFMFLLGCELRLTGLAARRRTVAVVVTGAMGLTLVAGVVVALLGHRLIGGAAQRPVTVLFFGLALSITALPVLARILADLGLTRTSLGGLAIGCAAAGDVVLWLGLTALLGAAGVGGSAAFATTAGAVAALLLVTVLWIRPALAAIVRWAQRRPDATQVLLPVLVAGAIAYAAGTQVVGLHPVLGAFVFGLAVPRDSAVVEHVNERLRGFTMAVLLPLFFAGIGLVTSVGLLGGEPLRWLFFAGVILAASGGKFLGAGVGARLLGLPRRDALRLGVLLNCRGVTEIVVAAIGWQYHLVNDFGLTVLVLVALVTTAMTGPLMNLLGDPAPAPTERKPPDGPTPRPRTAAAPSAR